MKVSIIGAGSWGTTVAALLAEEIDNVFLWARRKSLAETINGSYENPDYLPGIKLPRNLTATSDIELVLREAELVVFAVPSQFLRSVLEKTEPFIEKDSILLSLVKGIEEKTLMRMSEVIGEVIDEKTVDRIAVLSGPNHSEEVIRKIPTATVIASNEKRIAEKLQDIFMRSYFRVYTSSDVIGVELGAAVKNVLAIAVGISDGLGYGDNTRASLITRGLAEMVRLGKKLGANPLTFLGLSGIGDLITTATSRHSRNRNLGEKIGKGKTLDEVLSTMKMVAEGVRTSRSIYKLSGKLQIEMPVTKEVVKILFKNKEPRQSVLSLMERTPKSESEETAF